LNNRNPKPTIIANNNADTRILSIIYISPLIIISYYHFTIKLQYVLWILIKLFCPVQYGNFSKNEDGSFIVQTRLPDGDWLINYILSYGSVAEVLEPESIRKLVRESLKNTLKQYDINI
jgi:hypothetical protein